MSPETKSLKKDLRLAIIAKTLSFTESDRLQASHDLQNNISSFLKNHTGYWGAFQPLKTEPQISFSHLSSDIKLCFPKVNGQELEFYSNVSKWATSDLNVLEPVDGTKITAGSLSGVFVPALGFTMRGQRLGRGKGYYDRFLQHYSGLKVGLCYHFNILNTIPTESHDVGMDYIITNEKIIQPHTENTGDSNSWN